ncbi:MAG: HlyD family efflux transporter periplasmic adaptor subunit [Wenzhouxiangellaceae bacterium]|nr:HlyD family efflux transporter periplasmic adaptor subunit [Wenzhouxiangellaceae bacterium]
MNSLFRKEVLTARQNEWLGGISLVQPVRGWILAGFAITAATLVLLFLFFGDYTRRSRVSGQLVPSAGLVTVMAPAVGVIQKMLVDEGESVSQGQALGIVSVPRALASGVRVADALGEVLRRRQAGAAGEARSREALMRAQAAGIERQIRIARDELEGIAKEIATRGQQVRLARKILERYRRLSSDHFVSELELQQQEQLVLEQVSTRQGLERQHRSILRTVAQLEQRLAEMPAQQATQDAVLEQELAVIARDRVQTLTGAELMVKAPAAGMVASRTVEVGQGVQAGQPLLTLLPKDSGLEARLLLPSRAIGFIEPGDSVLLRYQAFPHQKFGHHRGTVRQVSRSALAEANSMTGAQEGREPVYRVRVELEAQTIMAYGKPEALRPGMLVQADILGESRKLYEWVLEPLYSVYGSVVGDP